MATTTIIGNLVDEPTLRFTPNGDAVANVTIAHTERRYNQDTKEWEDKGEPLFLRGSLWRKAAENAAESFSKGDRVIATGKLVQRSWEDNDGNKRYVVELDIFDIGASTRMATLKVTKNAPKGTDNGTPPPDGWGMRSGTKSQAKSKARNDDPWGDVPPPAEPDDSGQPPF